ncbi:hydrolase [Streptomyces tropicalis]|uniref:Hydrolase n=1 Tax=Streptomyces tropicalis TaxID=3034234 RepID=A0ABT6A4N5_9ACTN|nr:hydrolase [Streptomyces tropicalis]MDF3299609.1 hydrolase [Streptomyces tropicalis]
MARLRDPDGGHHAVALLLSRHWRASYDYAAVCLAGAGGSASMVATAAFHRVLRRLGGGAAGGALRPQLLVAVRDTVRDWAADEAACVVLPELRRPAGGRGLRAVRAVSSEKRQLAEWSFQSLPGSAQCLLWHAEVEAEPITIPAGLLALDADTAAVALEQAREQFRAGCVRAHRQLAPTRECRFYNAILAVPSLRAGAPRPDVRRHVRECRHCRLADEQFGLLDDGLPLLLAETVLGWGARRYLGSRVLRTVPPRPRPRSAVRLRSAAGPGGRHRGAVAGGGGPVRRHRTALVVGVGLASLALLATVLAVKGWTDGRGVPGRPVIWGAVGGRDAGTGEAGTPSAASNGSPAPVRAAQSGARTAAIAGNVRTGRGAAAPDPGADRSARTGQYGPAEPCSGRRDAYETRDDHRSATVGAAAARCASAPTRPPSPRGDGRFLAHTVESAVGRAVRLIRLAARGSGCAVRPGGTVVLHSPSARGGLLPGRAGARTAGVARGPSDGAVRTAAGAGPSCARALGARDGALAAAARGAGAVVRSRPADTAAGGRPPRAATGERRAAALPSGTGAGAVPSADNGVGRAADNGVVPASDNGAVPDGRAPHRGSGASAPRPGAPVAAHGAPSPSAAGPGGGLRTAGRPVARPRTPAARLRHETVADRDRLIRCGR